MVRVIDVFNANAVPNPIVGDAMREILRDLVDDVQANPAVIPAAWPRPTDLTEGFSF
jgi:hypothetical protein